METKIIKLYNLSPLLFFFILLALINALHPAPGKSAEQTFVSLKVIDETLEKTLSHLSKISGYTINLQSRWHNLPVTVDLLNVPLEQAIPRIIGKRINHAIVWNDKEKKITIIIIGISQKKKEFNEFRKQQKQLNGQGTRFGQASRTTEY